tara:strand:- start:1202 stop:2371 length:1170 start_codon:yes stop_codon:yes gene_type:complete
METRVNQLGQKIKRYRLLNDIRQEDMADKMGVSRATLINYEKGHTAINFDVLNRLKNFYPDFELEDKESDRPKIITNSTIDFKVLLKALIEKKIFIIFFTLFVTILGTCSSFLFTKLYTAQISLYPAKTDISQGLGQFQSLAANLGMNSANSDQNFNIPDVVKSRRISLNVVNQKWVSKSGKKIDLINLWKLNKPSWISTFNNNDIDSLVIIEKATKRFKDHVKVTEDRMSGLIRVSTTFQDPFIASAIANFIGKQVEVYIQKENSAQSTKEKIFISDRLSIVKKELEQTESALKNFKERNRGYEESPELFMIFSQLFREVEAKKQVYLTLQQQLELARIEEVKQSPIIHILDYAVPPIRKSFPRRSVFIFTSFFIGLLFSSLNVIFRY